MHVCIQFNFSLLSPYSVIPSGPLVVTKKDSSSVSLSWKRPSADHYNGQLMGYTVEIEDLNGVPQKAPKETTNTFEISTQIDGLKSDTEYIFHVSARTAAGSGPTATVSGCTTEGGKGCLSKNIIIPYVHVQQGVK